VARLILREAIGARCCRRNDRDPCSLIATRPLAMFLVSSVAVTDPITFAGVLAVLVLTATAAAWGPVRRASRVEPVTALRYE
jgi:ABC-type antimicrobial peptide transport system permease subunit